MKIPNGLKGKFTRHGTCQRSFDVDTRFRRIWIFERVSSISRNHAATVTADLDVQTKNFPWSFRDLRESNA